jgi:hypothetical protein
MRRSGGRLLDFPHVNCGVYIVKVAGLDGVAATTEKVALTDE